MNVSDAELKDLAGYIDEAIDGDPFDVQLGQLLIFRQLLSAELARRAQTESVPAELVDGRRTETTTSAADKEN